MGMIEECDIAQPRGFGVFQRTFPVSRSAPIMSASLPPGAITAAAPSMRGHCPVYQSGVTVPNSFSRSRPHLSAPLSASTAITWQRGPIVTTTLSVTAGTVRDIPWFRTTFTR